MQQLDEIIKYYLISDTNYALMITGEWGVGKTYYFKNILKNQIKETPTFEDNSKKYKPLLVSLLIRICTKIAAAGADLQSAPFRFGIFNPVIK